MVAAAHKAAHWVGRGGYRRRGVLAWSVQVAGVAACLALLVAASATAWQRLREQGSASGFDILGHATGWSIGSPFLSQTASDPYWWTLVVALVNTVVVGALSIVLASILGLCVGLGLVARNRVLKTLCSVYVDVFRNVPLVLQATFWYVTFINLPQPRAEPPSVLGWVFLTNKGVFLPRPVLTSGTAPVIVVIGVLAATCLFASTRPQRGPRRRVLAGVGIWLAVATAALCIRSGLPLVVEVPVLKGFSFRGGVDVPIEFVALTFGIVVFSAAYVAEIVRGGLQSVSRGTSEAARSLGLSAWATLWKIELPIALRSMIPPLGNQYLFIVKATALGIAVGYSDLFATVVVSISQTGQTIEFLAIMMGIYLIINYSLTQVMAFCNRRLALRGR